MGAVDWMKHHSWWLSIPAGLAFERLLAYLTSIDLLGSAWQLLGTAGQHLAAYLRADLTFPAWALIALVVPLLLIISWLYRERSQLSQSLAAATTELEALKQPKPPEPINLSSVQETVLFWAVVIYNIQQTGAGTPLSDIASLSGLPLTTIEAALDVLKSQGVVKMKKYKLDPVDLTPEGRAYMGRKEVSLRYDRFVTRSGDEEQAH